MTVRSAPDVAGASRSASSGADSGSQSLRALTVDIWDSVSRVGEGLGPDEADLAVLHRAAVELRGQVKAIEFVVKDASGVAPSASMRGLDAFLDVMWDAALQLSVDYLGEDAVEGLTVLASSLDRIADGDRVLARQFDPLVERISRLAEQSSDFDVRATG